MGGRRSGRDEREKVWCCCVERREERDSLRAAGEGEGVEVRRVKKGRSEGYGREKTRFRRGGRRSTGSCFTALAIAGVVDQTSEAVVSDICTGGVDENLSTMKRKERGRTGRKAIGP